MQAENTKQFLFKSNITLFRQFSIVTLYTLFSFSFTTVIRFPFSIIHTRCVKDTTAVVAVESVAAKHSNL